MDRVWAILGVVVLAGCGGGGSTAPSAPSTNLRPAEAPDVVILSVSGRCSVLSLCNPPEDNSAYLGEAGDASRAVENAFFDAGRSTERADFFSSMYSYDDDGDGDADRLGFVHLVATLEGVYDQWIRGFDNPTRIVIVAHSHGCVWAHIATSVAQHVPIDYLISLDANCLGWPSAYRPDITEYFNANGNRWWWDFRDPCDHWLIPGLDDAADTEDVVWPNVATNLEVRSNDGFGVSDWQINHRGDGSRTGVRTFDAPTDDHEEAHLPGYESMTWVLDMLHSFGH